MPIDDFVLASGVDTVDATSFTTGSISPTGDRLILAAIYNNIGSGTPNTPTLSGNGLTWVEVNTRRDGTGRITVFRAMGAAPSAGAVTIDFAGQTQANCGWQITEFSDVDTGGTNGSAAVVQSAVNGENATSTSLTVTLAAFGDAANATYGAIGVASAGTITPGSGFTEIAEVTIVGSRVMETEFRNDNDTSVDWSYTSSSGVKHAVAVEIKAGGATNATPTPSTVAGTGAIPASSEQTGSTISPSTVAGTGGVSSAEAQAGSSVSPAAVAGTASVPATTQTASSTPTPASVGAVTDIDEFSAEIDETVTPSTVQATATVENPEAGAQISSTVTPSTVQATSSIGGAPPSEDGEYVDKNYYPEIMGCLGFFPLIPS